jgi:hypothetical protein
MTTTIIITTTRQQQQCEQWIRSNWHLVELKFRFVLFSLPIHPPHREFQEFQFLPTLCFCFSINLFQQIPDSGGVVVDFGF